MPNCQYRTDESNAKVQHISLQKWVDTTITVPKGEATDENVRTS